MASVAGEKIRVVLVGTTHPGNIGASARAMKAMGLSRLYLVTPKVFPNADATAMASGADDLLAHATVCASLAEAVADCRLVVGTSVRQRSISWPTLAPNAAAERICAATVHGEVAVVFGREHSGLSNAEVDHCQLMIEIPTSEDFRSLNLAAAVQVIAYEIHSRNLADMTAANSTATNDVLSEPFPGAVTQISRDASPPPTADQIAALLEHVEQAMTDVDFFDPSKPRRLPRRIRRLVNRAQLDSDEVQILRGFLAGIQKKLRGSDAS
jgi:tRNA (cytidine32/uridine32-2'-O)-methyltransferase